MTQGENYDHYESSTSTYVSELHNLTRLALENSTQVRGGARVDLLQQGAHIIRDLDSTTRIIPASVAWRFGSAHHMRGEFTKAIKYFAMADVDPKNASASDRALVAAGFASSRWAQGDFDAARKLANEALSLANESGDHLALAVANVSQALLFTAEGKRAENARAYQTALTHAEQAGDAITMVRVRCNLASRHSEEGRYDAALAEANRAISLAEGADVGIAGAIAFITRAEVFLSLGRLDEALAETRVAVDAYFAVGSPMDNLALLLEAEIQRMRGNATRAHVAYREAIDRAHQTGNAQILAVASAGLARTLIADNRGAAVEYAAQALNQPNALGGVAAQLAAGWVALAVGETDVASERARDAITEAGRRRDVAALADALELNAISRWKTDPTSDDVGSMLAEAGGIWCEIDDPIRIAINRAVVARVNGSRPDEESALRALPALGVRAEIFRIAGPLQAIGRADVPPTELRTLGSFALLQEGEAMSSDVWPSRKSREVVKILASRRGRPISREALGELLWPGVRDTSPRLSVALSNARIALDPARQHPADYFISSSHSKLRLNLETVRVDIVEFEEVSRAALRADGEGTADALAMLEAAAALYPAPFLADEADADWSSEVRDEVRELSATVKRALVRLLSQNDDADGAIRWLVSLLNDDPYDGSAHHNLIKVLARTQRFSETQHAHRRYVSRMAELDVEPTSLTELVGSRLGT